MASCTPYVRSRNRGGPDTQRFPWHGYRGVSSSTPSSHCTLYETDRDFRLSARRRWRASLNKNANTYVIEVPR